MVQILLRMCPNLDDARDALLAYIEAVHSGIKGFVTDAETGRGISGASVSTYSRGPNTRVDTLIHFWSPFILIRDSFLQFSSFWGIFLVLFLAEFANQVMRVKLIWPYLL